MLLCSDVASEIINLHYLSHRLVHFDLLVVDGLPAAQRQVDRYSQNEGMIITYLINRSDTPRSRDLYSGSSRKRTSRPKNIGDPATFMKVHDPTPKKN